MQAVNRVKRLRRGLLWLSVAALVLGYSIIMRRIQQVLKRQVAQQTQEIQRASQELEKQFAQLQDENDLRNRIIKYSPSGMLLFDLDYNVVLMNKSACGIAGQKESWVGRSAREVPVFREILEKEGPSVFVPGMTVENGILRLGDSPGQMRVYSYLLYQVNQYGRVAGVLLSVSDMTKAERMQQAEFDKQKSQALTRIAAGIAHEIRNPLMSIGTFATLIGTRGEDKQVQESFAKYVPGEVDRINRLIENLIHYAKPAKRLTELTGHSASTIHRLLEVDYSTGSVRFIHNEKNLLPFDVIILDEMSMVDAKLFQALLAAARYHCRIIMVGDADQLPSVGPGSVLGEILQADVLPTVRLNEIFRQAQKSMIVQNAHRIVEGQMPIKGGRDDDFFMIESTGLACQRLICDLVSTRLPKSYGYDPVRDIQVLCPTKVGPTGSVELNRRLQAILNPPAPDKPQIIWEQSGRVLRCGDKVMQIKNNYQLEWEVVSRYGIPIDKGVGIFNGDMGIIREIDEYAQTVLVEYDEQRRVTYTYPQMEEVELAYAITIHKSQGSEYPAVIMPLLGGPRLLFNRNLLYTGVTRARGCVTILGSRKVVQEMIANESESRRYTSLDVRIRELKGEA